MTKDTNDKKLTIERTLQVKLSIEKAFDLFTKKFSEWWPKDYTWSRDTLETITIEPRVNGKCFERGPYGFECQFGRVLVWQPPKEISFTWQINDKGQPEPNPNKSSIVDVKFIGKDTNNTEIKFTHKDIENHGENAQNYFEELNSEYGWTTILNRYLDEAKN